MSCLVFRLAAQYARQAKMADLISSPVVQVADVLVSRAWRQAKSNTTHVTFFRHELVDGSL